MTAVCTSTLPQLAEAVPTPGYDRSQIRSGVVHLGVGGFHRSHEAMYLDRLLSEQPCTDWGITGVGILDADAAMQEALLAQDCLYTLTVREAGGALKPQIIGSLIDYLFVPDDPGAVIERMAAETCRIVSLTITEGGYNIDPMSGAFNPRDPAVQRDLRPDSVPRTVFGLVTEALRLRRDRGLPAFTVLSCDNIEGNGDVARHAFTAFAELADPDLGRWVAQSVAFPNSMVDRITPMTTEADRQQLSERFHIEDRWPVVCEPFTQWVIEDTFSAGRPPLEAVDVQMVHDVRPYELMKLRLLNGGHQALGFLGSLSGYRFVHEAAADPVIIRFLTTYMDHEVTPTLEQPAGIDLDSYTALLLERFANPGVADRLARLCAFTSDRIPKFVLPVIRDQLARGGNVNRAALIVAAWARYAEGADEQGRPIEVQDALRGPLMVAAGGQRSNPLAFLEVREVFGDLAQDRRFAGPFLHAVDLLHRLGVHKTLEIVNTA